MQSRQLRRDLIAAFAIFSALQLRTSAAGDDGRKLAPIFEQQVTRRLNVPQEERAHYAQLLNSALENAEVSQLPPQYILLVDRNPHVQAAMIEWKAPDGMFHLIGATPVSTGRPGRYEHFGTPLGVYEHRTSNPDFRSKGTRNEFGIRGYGVQGLRIFDFGWVEAPKGWGDHALSRLRLQVHATDPDRLDPRLGTPQSEGCVRTTASFNVFLDRYGILDADYEKAGHWKSSVLYPRREATQWSGRYLVIVDSQLQARPAWARTSPPAKTRSNSRTQRRP